MHIVILAALAMVVQDILAVMMVQAEARDRGWTAGFLDAAGWGFGIATTTISVTALQGHSTGLKIAVVVAVTAANIIGSKMGQVIGTRYIKPLPNPIVQLLMDKGIISEQEWLETQHQQNKHVMNRLIKIEEDKAI